jgi:hypothetical protein
MGAEWLCFDEAIDVIPSGGGVLRFVMPGGEFTLRDPTGLVGRVSSALRCGAKADDMLAEVEAPTEREAVGQLIDLFKSRRLLKTGAGPAAGDPLTGWIRHYAGVAGKTAACVDIRGHGLLARFLRERLRGEGLAVEASDLACIVAVADTPDFPWLREQNAHACAGGRTFLPAWLERSSIHWGPMLVPGATGCLECRLHRQQAARKRAETLVDARQDLSISPAVAAVGAGLVSAEALRWALDAHVDTELGMAWSFDLVSMAMSGSKVLRLPRCPACGVG